MKSSRALIDFLDDIKEVVLLQSIVNRPIGHLPTSYEIRLENSVNRAALVLLSSYFERYIYNLNEEICEFVNSNKVKSQYLSDEIRLLHAKIDIEKIQEMQWMGWKGHLEEYNSNVSWMFTVNATGKIKHDRLLIWMKAPNTKNIFRYFKMWGLENIFLLSSDGNRKIEARLRIHIDDMVTKRNSIAHGDSNASVSSKSLEANIRCVKLFCSKADKIICRQIVDLWAASLKIDIVF